MRHTASGGAARSPDFDPESGVESGVSSRARSVVETQNEAAHSLAAEPGLADAHSLAAASETAEYVADLLSQLERLAHAHGLVRLQYLLIQARDEAQEIARLGEGGSTPAAEVGPSTSPV